MKKFYGIINHHDFDGLELEEKYKYLIDKNIYVLGNPKEKLSEFEISSFYEMERYSATKFIGNDIVYKKRCYNINNLILEEIFINLKKEFVEAYNKNKYNVEVYNQQILLYSKDQILKEETELGLKKVTALQNKIYRDLIECDDLLDLEHHFSILRRFLDYDFNTIYSYLIGIDNLKNSVLVGVYWKYISNSFLFDSISNNINSDFSKVKSSIPKKIALLSDLGLFETEKFKKFKPNEITFLLAFLFDVDFNNKSALDIIRRNYKSLSLDSEENTNKFTASKHLGTVIRTILGNKN
jgi:hypothetical protein